MKHLFLIANWKSNKRKAESIAWIQQVSSIRYDVSSKEVVVCPSFTLLPDLHSYILDRTSSIKLSAQDISPYDEGPYTGAVNGKQIKEFAEYVVVGHSERRNYFHEDDTTIEKKLSIAARFSLIPILCISDPKQLSTLNFQLSTSTLLVAYEPVFAIGSGTPDTPENANEIARIIKEKKTTQYVLYGGSVTSENVKSFTSMPDIDGVLVGGASLDAKEFSEIIQNA